MTTNGLRSFVFALLGGLILWGIVILVFVMLSGCVAPRDSWQPTYLGVESAHRTVPVYYPTLTRLEPMQRPDPVPDPGRFVQTPYAPTLMRPR